MHSVQTRKHVEGTGIDRVGEIKSGLVVFYTLAYYKHRAKSQGSKKGIHGFLIRTKGESPMGSGDGEA